MQTRQVIFSAFCLESTWHPLGVSPGGPQVDLKMIAWSED